MTEELTPEQQETISDLTKLILSDLSNNKSKDSIVRGIVKSQELLDMDAVTKLVDDTEAAFNKVNSEIKQPAKPTMSITTYSWIGAAIFFSLHYVTKGAVPGGVPRCCAWWDNWRFSRLDN